MLNVSSYCDAVYGMDNYSTVLVLFMEYGLGSGGLPLNKSDITDT